KDEIVARADQRAERGLGDRHAETEKGKRRLVHDGARNLRGGNHDQRREDVGKDVAPDDAEAGETERTGRSYMVLGGFDLSRSARGPREIRPFGKADDDDEKRHGVAAQGIAAEPGA